MPGRSPDGMQRLFTAARWDQNAVRDDVRGYVVSALGGPDGVLIGDGTGFEKKGSCSGRGLAAVHGHGREDHELPLCRRPGGGHITRSSGSRRCHDRVLPSLGAIAGDRDDDAQDQHHAEEQTEIAEQRQHAKPAGQRGATLDAE